ncbi:hypothetical protein [Rhizobium sp. SG570]|uniref:hypothetical protein n=1 Tax=Rhizobium sp. SG570 TaxID=2587113 RepID=UPI001447645F|nr:hypothetical protein [Rhizobium sp. SG570]NKJ39570.1 O6-methylguanine-DNA--protein-cysteine methyltransferase [Rhizobium sp. SG570]NRP90635.1 hypothetical protein [Ensifer adhaerens]
MAFAFETAATPVGLLKIVATDVALAAILWENDDPKRVRLAPLVEDIDHPVLLLVERQLGEYFAGTRKRSDVSLVIEGTILDEGERPIDRI